MNYYLEKNKNKLQLRFVNTEKNQDLLRHTPHFKWHDLSCICVLATEGTGQVKVTVTVSDALMESWGIERDALFETALCSMMRMLPPRLIRMDDLLKRAGVFVDEMYGQVPLYYLSNKSTWFGATVLLYPKILEKIAKLIGAEELYLLPSSVHEFLILPKTGEEKAEELADVVRTVNQIVAKEERLSDHVYLFSQETGKTVLAA